MSRRRGSGGGRRRGTSAAGFDIEGNLGETDAPHRIQRLDHVTVTGVGITADVNRRLRILRVTLGELAIQFGKGHCLGIEEHISRGIDAEVDHVRLEV